MISDFYEAVLSGRKIDNTKEKEEKDKTVKNFQDNRPIVRVGAKELAASIIAQNIPKPNRVLTIQEQLENKTKAEKRVADMIKQNRIIQA